MDTTTLPRKKEVAESTIVEALAEDVAVHGWLITSYSVKQDLEKQERRLTISLHRSTGEAQQENMDLQNGEKPRRRGRKPAAE